MMARFQAAQPTGVAVAQLEILVRTAVFRTANELVGWMLSKPSSASTPLTNLSPEKSARAGTLLLPRGFSGISH